MPRRLLAAIAFSTVLAFLLSLIPTVGSLSQKEDVPAFQAAKPIVLGEHNLVDLFTFMQTHYNIKRVKWENRTLFVDIVVRPTEEADLSVLYRDFYTVAYDAFRYTQNVHSLFFRVVEEAKETRGNSTLLVAIEAKRPSDLKQWPAPEQVDNYSRYIEKTFPVRIEPYFRERVSP
ncbi:hypothetical protein [Brevibacillus migulae]|uniref:hypothetical protein n=1 Tax=Brevibacillus migulae TaxID=1644114 RepID=UPI00106EDE88|nr:hypothetical protein [Brevibacillus migulae]